MKKNLLRYFFHIAYRGTNYCGWQKHAEVISVQQTIESALEAIFKIKIPIIGCGRTDSGVHASQFFFHADFAWPWDFDLKFRLNMVLPKDISIYDIIQMEGRPHARFDAFERHYDYFFHTYKDPFLAPSSALYLNLILDLPKMQAAASILTQYSDYRAFCKSPDKNAHTLCMVNMVYLEADPKKERFRFHIRSNRFLSGMIRIIVYKLMEVGTGVLSADEFENYLAKKITPKIIKPAYPEGLFLSKVKYPYMDLLNKNSISELWYKTGC